MPATFTTTIQKDGEKNATGIRVPDEVIASLGSSKKPAVIVTLNGYTYRSTVAVMGGVFMVPLSQEHRQSANVQGGETLDITLELDTEPRTVSVPDDLAQALSDADARTVFDALAYSVRKEHVRQVESAKTQDTRLRRIAAVVEKVRSSK